MTFIKKKTYSVFKTKQKKKKRTIAKKMQDFLIVMINQYL